MDFLDPKKRRAHRIQLFIGYGLMVLAVGISTWLLVNITFGYGLDRKTGDIIQNGLVFIDSHPVSANIFLNGQNKGTTSAKLTIPEGAYTLDLKRDGYRSWKRGFTLSGGSVERYVYPFLFPTKLVTKDVDLFTAAPGLATSSPDRRWFISEQGTSLTNFDQVDLISALNSTSTISLPDDIFTAAPGEHRLALVEWSTDNRHLLIKHTFATSQNEYVMVDREQPASSVNISKLFPALPIAQLSLRDKKFEQLYALTSDGVLQSLDTKTKLTNPIASHVINFKSSGADQILYISSEDAPTNSVSVKLHESSATYNIRKLPSGTTYLLDLASYNGAQYVVVGAVSEGKVYDYKNPVNFLKALPNSPLVPVALLKANQPTMVSFSLTAQIVVVQGGSSFAVYDAESDRHYRYDIKMPVDSNQNASWMDGHRIAVLNKSKVVIFDFDGANPQTLAAANVGYIPYFDRDYTAMYTIATSIDVKDHVALTRTELKVK